MTAAPPSSSPGRIRLDRLRLAALYAGGFLGPFGGGITASMLPELGADLGLSPSGAAASLTAYLLPFALLMLVSGTLGQRWGARRTVRAAYVAYVVFSVLAAVAGVGWLFLGARALQGAANAFTTPLLLSALAAASPPDRLGRSLGVFGSLQAAGQTFAPLVGGLAAELDWRLAFAGVAAVAALLALAGLPADPRPEDTDRRPRLRDAWRPAVLRLGLVAGLGWGALGGLSFLVALRVEDAFTLGAGLRGALLTAFGVAGLLTARLVGAGVDRVGPGVLVRWGAVVGAVLVAAIGVLPSAVAVAAVWAAAGAAAQLLLVGVNALVLRGGTPGGVSVVQALRFLGAAAAPAVFLAPYHLSPVAGFAVAGVLLAVAAVLVPRR
ncbi:MFS transporter [Actinomycetospora cinnamomea]|uniref:Putative MFS family arabinose efflux permease n=1 Tax=Actinomycetospora cinnamomea TaxID=663609 RepID=A0A2U1EUT6_9PSEU|nr:MFS transporter [Actinomycetospora cinnamomea]PVZ03682.1 putative MFS family arabinose efflux permease [Actinomycetospora cinnamomea]